MGWVGTVDAVAMAAEAVAVRAAATGEVAQAVSKRNDGLFFSN